MKRKIVSVILAVSMCGALLAGCGSESSSSVLGETTSPNSKDGEFELDTLNIIVDGTLTATVENGQDAFVEQWEDAIHKMDEIALKYKKDIPSISGKLCMIFLEDIEEYDKKWKAYNSDNKV